MHPFVLGVGKSDRSARGYEEEHIEACSTKASGCGAHLVPRNLSSFLRSYQLCSRFSSCQLHRLYHTRFGTHVYLQDCFCQTERGGETSAIPSKLGRYVHLKYVRGRLDFRGGLWIWWMGELDQLPASSRYIRTLCQVLPVSS